MSWVSVGSYLDVVQVDFGFKELEVRGSGHVLDDLFLGAIKNVGVHAFALQFGSDGLANRIIDAIQLVR